MGIYLENLRILMVVRRDVTVLGLFVFSQELIGAPAGKLHTGRSRNDQVCLHRVKTQMSERSFWVSACELFQRKE